MKMVERLTVINTDVSVQWTWQHPVLCLDYLCHSSCMNVWTTVYFPVVCSVDPDLWVCISKANSKASEIINQKSCKTHHWSKHIHMQFLDAYAIGHIPYLDEPLVSYQNKILIHHFDWSNIFLSETKNTCRGMSSSLGYKDKFWGEIDSLTKLWSPSPLLLMVSKNFELWKLGIYS